MFFKSLPYTTRNKLLLVGGLLLLYFSYQWSIKKTVDLYGENKKILAQKEELVNAPARLQSLSLRMAELEKKVNTREIENFRETFLDSVSGYCQKKSIIIRDFPSSYVNDEDGYKVETNVLEVEADYVNLVKFLYHLEQELKIGKVVATEFRLKKDNRTLSVALVCDIYIQNIITHEG